MDSLAVTSAVCTTHRRNARVGRRERRRCGRRRHGCGAYDVRDYIVGATTTRRLADDDEDVGDGVDDVSACGAKAASLGILFKEKDDDDGQGTGTTTDTSGSGGDEWER
jgi:hypothetical protein